MKGIYKYRLKINFKREILLFAVLVIITNIFFVSFIKAESAIPKIYTKDATPFGQSYGSWIGKWWQWNVNIPLQGHPRDSFSTEKCNTNQNGPVWFLPDILSGKEDRTCVIPSGKAVLIPMNTGACWNDGNPTFRSDTELRNCAMQGQEGTFMNAYINDTKLNGLSENRVQSPFYNLTIAKDSWTRYNKEASGQIFECTKCPVGSFKTIADGFFIFLEPLSAGTYNVKYSYDTIANSNPEYRHAAGVTYHLIVKPSL